MTKGLIWGNKQPLPNFHAHILKAEQWLYACWTIHHASLAHVQLMSNKKYRAIQDIVCASVDFVCLTDAFVIRLWDKNTETGEKKRSPWSSSCSTSSPPISKHCFDITPKVLNNNLLWICNETVHFYCNEKRPSPPTALAASQWNHGHNPLKQMGIHKQFKKNFNFVCLWSNYYTLYNIYK